MKRLILLIASLLCSINVHAVQPTNESVEKLLQITRAESMVNIVHEQVTSSIAGMFKQAVLGKQTTEGLSAEQTAQLQEMIEIMGPKIQKIFDNTLSWEVQKAMYVRVYQEAYTQEEVNDLIVFYGSPTGQSFIEKTPVVMKKVMQLSQEQLNPVMLQVQQVITESVKEYETKHASQRK